MNKLMYKTSLCSLKKGEKPCYQCSVQHNGTVTKDAVTDDISSQTGLRPAVVTCVLDLLIENLKKGYQNGQRINLGELAGGIVATGSFSGPEEKWDPAKHRLVPYLNTKGALRGCLEAYTPTNVTTGAKVSVKRVLDVVHAVEGLIVGTADVAVQVSGMGLSVDVEAEDEGCWLEAKDGTVAATGQVTAAASTTLDMTFAALPPDGKTKKITAKAATVQAGGAGATLAFKAPIGEMAFEMSADGTFTLKNGSYLMSEATVGGALKGDTRGTFRLEGFDLAVPGELQEDLLPNEVAFDAAGGKWKFAKNASVKWAKDKATKEYALVVDDAKGKTNRSSLKLTYAAKTGIFKGSFKAYALEEKNGKTKLVKYTVNVLGLVVDGVGQGEATCKKPAAGPWPVTVE